MKFTLALGFAMIAGSATAANPEMFRGRYTIEPSETCAFGVDATRAYISVATDHRGVKMMTIQAYGLESRSRNFPVEKTTAVRQLAGGGQMIERTRITWPAAGTMRVATTVEERGGGVDQTYTYTLKYQGSKITFREVETGTSNFEARCVLVRR